MPRIVITGATSGIGRAALPLLARLGEVVAHGPEPVAPDRLEAAHYLPADFSRLDEVRSLADRILELGAPDVLIGNAAIPGPRTLRRSADGIELAFQVDYLAGALLADLLLPAMPATGRVVNTASATHLSAALDLDDLDFRARPYSPVAAYARAKLAVVTATRGLARRVPQTVVSLHPGVVSTALLHDMFGVGGDPVEHGARNLAAAVTAEVPSGSYLDEDRPAAPNPIADDPAFQARLREVTGALLARDLL